MADIEGTPVGRRVFLSLVGLAAGAVAAGGPLSRMFGAVQQGLAGTGAAGLGELLPGGNWRYYTVTGTFPQEPAAQYRLTVTGLVQRPLTLALADLRARPRATLVRDFQCVTGWRVAGVHWGGVSLATLLEESGVLPGAGGVRFHSFDGVYTESLTLEQARRPDVIVADSMAGGPVPREHGGPARLVVGPMYGYKSCKWLSGIEVTAAVQPGYWERFGYDQDGWVGRSNGRSDAPT